MKKEIPFKEQFNRQKIDRRIRFGIWSRHQRRKGLPKTYQDLFKKEWVFLAHGDLRFPDTVLENSNWTCLRDIGERRAAYAEHPYHKTTLMEAKDSLKFCDWKHFLRNDPETNYISYLVCIRNDKEHLIKVELDIDKFASRINEADYKEFEKLYQKLPNWADSYGSYGRDYARTTQ